MLLVILPLAFNAQSLNDNDMFPGDELWEEELYPTLESPQYGASGVVGAITLNGITYSQIRLRPELAFWKIGLGLDIDLLIDSNGKVRTEDWDDWQDIMGKIIYIRFADRKSPFYFKTGSIPDYTLGHGLIFDDFSNMLRYPQVKNIGGYVGINTNVAGLGFEVYTHNIFINEIVAGRLHSKPLQNLNLPWLSNIKIGVNAGIDRNQYGRYPDTDGDGYPDIYDKFPSDPNRWLDSDDDGIADNHDLDLNGNGVIDDPALNPAVETAFPGIGTAYPDYPFDNQLFPDVAQSYTTKKPLQIYSVDYELPFYESDVLTLSNYGEFAVIKDHGNGLIFPGFGAKFMFFDAKMEFRNFSSGFLPGYFDNLYEAKRSEVVYDQPDPVTGQRLYYLTTKDTILDSVTPTLGWFGFVRANIYDVAFLKLAFQDMYGKNMVAGKSLWIKLGSAPKVIPKLQEASIYYSQTNVDYIDLTSLRNSQAKLEGRLTYSIADNANLIGKYTERYTDLNNDGRIRGRNEIVELLSFGVEFTF